MEFDRDYSSALKTQNQKKYQYNGISAGLFQDPLRNQFYDHILKECKNKRCVDVGSGSGLLAFIALKHGAEHVTCFEQNPKSAAHIEAVARHMKLSKKITVINKEFIASNYHSYNLKDIDIIFHEVIGSYIWNESMYSAFDVPLPIRILPSHYDIQFSILNLTEDQYNELINLEVSPALSQPFNLGIDLPSQFSDYYQDVIKSTSYLYHSPTHILNIEKYAFNVLKSFYELNQMHVIGTHRFDINNPEHYEKRRVIQFKLPQTDDPYLIVIHPFFYCSQDLVFDFKTISAFTGYYRPVIVPPKSRHSAFRYRIFENDMKVGNLWIK
jgi:hypothetical protein